MRKYKILFDNDSELTEQEKEIISNEIITSDMIFEDFTIQNEVIAAITDCYNIDTITGTITF